MNSFRKHLAAIFLAAACCGPLCAQEARWVQDASGFSAPVPATLTCKQDATATVLSAEGYAIILKSHHYANFQAFAADANLARDGFQLVGEVQSFGQNGRCFRATRPTAEGYLIADTFVSFSPYGGGSVTVALSNERTANLAYANGLAIASGVQYSRPQATPWDSALSGKHLLSLYTSSGFSERTDIYLLPSRQFVFRRNTSSLSANGSGYLNGNSDGTWRTTPNGELVLQFANGNTRSYRLAPRQASNEISLNGARWFVLSE